MTTEGRKEQERKQNAFLYARIEYVIVRNRFF